MENWTLWIYAAIGLLVVEMLTPGVFVFAFFALGALLAAGAAALGLGSFAIWATFFISSVLLVVAARPMFTKMMNKGAKPSNVDELIGKEATVLAEIEPNKPGRVKIRGEEWRAEADTKVAVGSIVVIQKVEGTRLLVQPKA